MDVGARKIDLTLTKSYLCGQSLY